MRDRGRFRDLQNNGSEKVVIEVERKKLRTFHVPEGRRSHFDEDGTRRPFVLDREVTISLPAIHFGRERVQVSKIIEI